MGWELAQRITLPTTDGAKTDSQALSIHGNYLISSKWAANGAAALAPALQQVYIYESGNDGSWNLIHTLAGSDYGATDNQDGFGVGVCVHGNDFIVGQWKSAGTVPGRADIFRRDNDGEIRHVQTLTGTTVGDRFGITVWLSGNYAIVGANQDSERGANAGAVYIYQKKNDGTYDLLQKILGSAGAQVGGMTTRISDNYAMAIGANENHRGVDVPGVVHLYQRSRDGKWIELETLMLSTQANAGVDKFGIGISGNNLVAGLAGFNNGSDDDGQVRFYQRTNDGTVNLLKTFEGTANATDLLGRLVCLEGNYAAAITEDVAAGDRIHFYRRRNNGDWEEESIYQSTDVELGEFDGLDMHGNYLAITSPNFVVHGTILIFIRKY